SPGIRFVRSASLLLENAQNPIAERASRVDQWLHEQPLVTLDSAPVEARTEELMRLGLRNFDALHVASAEQAGAETFATCDDRILATAARNTDRIRIRIMNVVVELAKEILK